METRATQAQNLSDHDLLMRIDERTVELIQVIKGNGSDGLIRRVSKLEKFMWSLLAIGACVGWAVSIMQR